MNGERISRSLQRGLVSELQSIDAASEWKLLLVAEGNRFPCMEDSLPLVQGASIFEQDL